MSYGRRWEGAAALVIASLVAACTALPPRAPADPAQSAPAFAARRLEGRL